jgi:hypothetical protein
MTAITLPSPTAKLDFGRVIQQTFGVVGRNLALFLTLIVGCLSVPAAVIALGVLQTGAGGAPAGWLLVSLGYLLLMAGFAVVQPAMIHGAFADLSGRRATAGECLGSGVRHAVPLFLIMLLQYVAVMVGLVLLVFPGMMMLTAWLVTGPSQVVEKTGVFGAFSRSAALTRRNRWRIFGLVVLYFIVYLVVQQSLMNLFGVGMAARMAAARNGALSPFAAFGPGNWVVMAVMTVANTLVAYTGLAVVYFELRRVKEGVGPEALASVFD